MEIVGEIVDEIIGMEENEYCRIRTRIKGKSLSKADYARVVKIIETDLLAILKCGEFSTGEIHLLSKAILKAKLNNPARVADYLVQYPTKATPILLHSILLKGYTINYEFIVPYLERITAGELLVCHYKLLLVVARKYPKLITNEVIECCNKSKHPIAKEVINILKHIKIN